MRIDYPSQEQISQLRALWQEAFGDKEAFLEQFYTQGFAPDRCRCITEEEEVVAALYWFDCSYCNQPLAYLYGVATSKKYRKKGYCRALVENTHTHLKYLGYAGAVLVPATEELFSLYEKMGYSASCSAAEFTCDAEPGEVALRQVEQEEFCQLRRTYLPENGVIQEGDTTVFLATMADYYAGEDFLLTISKEENEAPELLGNIALAPQIVNALGRKRCKFRTPGEDKPFAMYHALSDAPAPGYFGLALD